MRENKEHRIFINLQKTPEGFYVSEEGGAAVHRKEAFATRAPPTPSSPSPENDASAPPGRLDVQGRFSAGFDRGEAVAVPTSAAWFDPRVIHRIEIDSLPEFFGDHPLKTPQAYKQLRNGLLALFYEAPGRHLLLSVSLGRLAADSCAIVRVHTFLEHWGLINFAFDPHDRDLAASTPINDNCQYAFEPKIAAVAADESPAACCTVCGHELGDSCWSTEKGEARLRLCGACFEQQRFPRLFVPSDFRRAACSPAAPEEPEWDDAAQLEFIRAFREVDCNPARLKELEARFGDADRMLARFLHYPLQHFKPIMRLSNNSIENLFKRRERPLAFDSRPDEALLETLMLLRLWFDYAEAAESPEQAGVPSAHSVVSAFVGKHREQIIRLKAQLLAQAQRAMQSAECEVLSEIRKINLIQMQKIEAKLRFLAEHQKTLLHGERVLLMEQNEALVNAYLS